jgi:acetyl-CoA acetyltransferase
MAGNSSTENDGAAACVMASEETAKKLGVKPLAYIKDFAVLGEAFAAQVLADLKMMKLTEKDYPRINVNGSGISLGHPIACTGTRVLVTLLHEMKRRNSRYGLECICGGGDLGIAAIFERSEPSPLVRTSFFKVDHLLAFGNEEPFSISHFEFNQADTIGTMGHPCCGLEEVSGFASR